MPKLLTKAEFKKKRPNGNYQNYLNFIIKNGSPAMKKLAKAAKAGGGGGGGGRAGGGAAPSWLSSPAMTYEQMVAQAEAEARGEIDPMRLELQNQIDQTMQQAQQQGQGLQNTATAQGITQASAMAPLQQQQARNAIALQQEQLTQQRAATAAALEAAKPQQSLPYGEPGKGYFAAVSPSGEAEYIPQPGSEPFNTATSRVRQLEEALRAINQFQESVEKAGASGTELVGPLANSIRFLRGNVISTVALARKLGTVQPADYEVLDSQLPDPTGLWRNAMANYGALDPTGSLFDLSRQSVQDPYTKLREEFELRLREARRQYWYVPAIPTLPEEAQRR